MSIQDNSPGTYKLLKHSSLAIRIMGIALVLAGIFVFLDERQPNPVVDGAVTIGIGVALLLLVAPLVNKYGQKAINDLEEVHKNNNQKK